jgi:hypothetical protein
MTAGPWTPFELAIARAICSDYPWDFDAMAPQAQAYWLRLARRFSAYLEASNISIEPQRAREAA